MTLDFEDIINKLAEKHNLSKEDYLDANIESLYSVDKDIELIFFEDEHDRVGNNVLIYRRTRVDKHDRNISSFVNFANEINPHLKNENLELTYVMETYSKGTIKEISEFYLTLIDNTLRDLKIDINKIDTETNLKLYAGNQVASNFDSIWFTSGNDNIKLKDLFDAIKIAYEDIHKVID